MEMKIKYLSSHQQFAILKALYKDSSGTLHASGFEWLCRIKPMPRSEYYTIKIIYHEGKVPCTFVVSPNKLPLALGATRLPHTYKSSRQKLCLYNPLYGEWNRTMPIATTIVHWAVQWLFFYELWRYTGKWYGGGHGNWDVPIEDSSRNVA